ncbi:MAG: hypothetical protein QM811_26890 [Pirellulales bacterium]
MIFVDDPLDNDRTQGVFDLLSGDDRRGKSGNEPDSRWSLLVVDPTGNDPALAMCYDAFAARLRIVRQRRDARRGIDRGRDAGRFAAGSNDRRSDVDRTFFTGVGGRTCRRGRLTLCRGRIVDGSGDRRRRGATARRRSRTRAKFRERPAFSNRVRLDSNTVLDFFGSERLASVDAPQATELIVRHAALAGFANWYDALCGERSNTLAAWIDVRSLRRDRLIDDRTGRSWTETQRAAIEADVDKARKQGRAVGELSLPGVEEYSLGQLFQLVSIAELLRNRS